MKVQELLMNIHNKDFDLEQALQIKKYLPINIKKELATDVIALCTDDLDGFVMVDKIKLRVYFTMTALFVYTELEVSPDFTDLVQEYDTLGASGLLGQIIKLIGDDYNICYDVVQDELNELLIENSFETQVVRVANKINKTLDVLTEKLSSVDFNTILPEGTNMNELVDVLKQLK